MFYQVTDTTDVKKQSTRNNKGPGEILNRYTSLPVLFYILSKKKLTLFPPNLWDDKNDSYYLEQYKKNCRLKTVLALCFSEKKSQTYHLWNSFAHGQAGVCIQFNREKLIAAIGDDIENKKIRCGKVTYEKLRRRQEVFESSCLPFTKRIAFKDEEEWRIIYQSKTKEEKTFDICIEISSINLVTLSPWLPKALKDPIRCAIQKIPGCERLKIERSTILNSEEWRNRAEMVSKSS